MPAATQALPEPGGGFSLVAGGPLHRLLRATRLARVNAVYVWRPAVALLIVAWLPLLILAIAERAGAPGWDPLLTDPSVIARFWVAAPLFFAAEAALHVRCGRAADRFLQSGLAGDATPAVVARALLKALHRRDQSRVEVALLVAALIGGQAALWGLTDATGFVEAAGDSLDRTPVRIWYALVSLPLYQFLTARWLWRWTIWSLVLTDFARPQLQLAPMHPDRVGGLGMLTDPTYAFAFFAGGNSSVLAAAWGAQLARGDVQLAAFLPKFVLLLILMTVLAFGPLLVFMPRMVRARYEGLHDYGLLALNYTRLFRRRWIDRGPDDALLGASDIQSLADLQGAYQSMSSMRVAPVSARSLVTVALGVVLPLLPLATFEAPLDELLLQIGKALFVGLPG